MRWPSATSPPCQMRQPSGPRWAIASSIRVNDSAATGRPSRLKTAANPLIVALRLTERHASDRFVRRDDEHSFCGQVTHHLVEVIAQHSRIGVIVQRLQFFEYPV